jgi:hypothetical protein
MLCRDNWGTNNIHHHEQNLTTSTSSNQLLSGITLTNCTKCVVNIDNKC